MPLSDLCLEILCLIAIKHKKSTHTGAFFVGAKWAILTAVILIPIIVISLLYGEHIETRSHDASNTKTVTVSVHPFGDYTLDVDKGGELFEALKQLD